MKTPERFAELKLIVRLVPIVRRVMIGVAGRPSIECTVTVIQKEKKALHKLGDHYIAYRAAEMSKLVREALIIEVRCHEQNS